MNEANWNHALQVRATAILREELGGTAAERFKVRIVDGVQADNQHGVGGLFGFSPWATYSAPLRVPRTVLARWIEDDGRVVGDTALLDNIETDLRNAIRSIADAILDGLANGRGCDPLGVPTITSAACWRYRGFSQSILRWYQPAAINGVDDQKNGLIIRTASFFPARKGEDVVRGIIHTSLVLAPHIASAPQAIDETASMDPA